MKEYISRSGYLDVGSGHRLYFEDWGSAAARPLLFLHGGPGLGCSEHDKRFFDASRHRVLFIDQRGSGRSTPSGSDADNTTQHLVRDILDLLDHLEIDEVTLFGGSWGATLALVFAIQHPTRVRSMILRGTFPATRECIIQTTCNPSPGRLDEWNRLISMMPEADTRSPLEVFYDQMRTGKTDEQERYALAWERYHYSLSGDVVPIKMLDAMSDGKAALIKGRIMSHYAIHDCFLPDQYLLNNASKLKGIPGVMIHGKNDLLCPVAFAIELSAQLPDLNLQIVEGGHSSFEPEIERSLLRYMQSYP